MSKRRRSSAVSDTKDEDGPLSPTQTGHTKRRKKSAPVLDPSDIIHDLYEIIRNHKTDEGKVLCETFIRAPKRRSDPDYFTVVSNPIDMLRIQAKMKMEEYDTVEQFAADVHLLVSNAKAYYKRGSLEFESACDLWSLFQDKRKEKDTSDDGSIDEDASEVAESTDAPTDEEEEMEEDEEQQTGRKNKPIRPTFKLPQEEMIPLTVEIHSPEIKSAEAKSLSSSGSQSGTRGSSKPGAALPRKVDEYTLDNPGDPLEQLFTAVMAEKGSDGRVISLLFQKLPSKAQFPGYYEVIDQPIDLKAIARKLKKKEYPGLTELENDLMLMVKNAKKFNEPGSQVHKDAMTLKKVIVNKKSELLASLKSPPLAPPASEKPNAAPNSAPITAPTDSESAITAAANISSDEDEDEPTPAPMEYEDEESGNESFLSDSNDVFYMLYDAVATAKDPLGHLICEPFMRLPSRRVYPDYYEEIEQPMALGKIRMKIKTRKYECLDELATDLDLLFSNAKTYNESKSKLYKDADHLQRLMLIRKKDLDRAEITVSKPEVSEDEGSVPEKKKRGRKPGSGVSAAGSTPTDDKTKKRGRESSEGKAGLKAALTTVVETLVQYKDRTDRYPISIFVEKPSKKLYPDYYSVIKEPIDMKTIETNVRNDKYASTEALIKDLELMFNNARTYNEEGSMVYEDANFLEKMMRDKCKELKLGMAGAPPAKSGTTPKSGATPGASKKPSQKKAAAPVPPSPSKVNNPIFQKLQDLYDTILKQVDTGGRELSAPFIVLPHKNEYPEYYQVIKKPIDMQRIQQRVQMKQYESLDDMVNDFLLMFDNACKFNEPDSLIYKDALTLQRLLLQTKTELMGDESSGVPDVQSVVREILTNLFVSLANYQDEEGRCFSDSLNEVPFDKDSMKDEATDAQKKPLDLDTVRRYLDRGCYRRLDCFQDHVFEVLERARNLTRTDSQVYEDAVEMQRFFIQIRDEICKNGEILLSPALSYTYKHMQNNIDKQKKEKLPKETKEDAEKQAESGEGDKDTADMQQGDIGNDGVVLQGQTYRIGDFVYVEPSDKTLKPHIVCIEKLWKDPDGEDWCHGNWFLRPNETFHLATRKFLEKEVFKSDYSNKVKMSQHVITKCHVMFVKDYFKNKPENFEEDDVFVCESRYSAKAKAFKKIKIWGVPAGSAKIVPREEPLSKIRVQSVFADGTPNLPVMENADEHWSVFDKEREDVEADVANGEEDCLYYEQLNFNHYVFKLGDCVYLRSDQDKPFIARIDKMWKDSNGDPWFQGPWFVRPSEIDHPPTRMFYRNEVFLSSIEDTNPMRSICGKCTVMAYKDHIISRPTEFNDEDVYVVESSYKEAERSIRKIKALKRYQVSNKVIDDEIYFFKKPIAPIKEPSPLLRQEIENGGESEEDRATVTTIDKEDTIETESMKTDDAAEVSSVVSTPARTKTIYDAAEVSSVVSTPARTKTPKPRHASGYILFASEVRAPTKQRNPEMNFGEISRLIGSDWRNLPPDEKLKYEERAQAIAAEKQEKEREKQLDSAANSPAPAVKGPAAGTIQVWECLWDGCDFQFEDQEDLLTHVTETSNHIQPQKKENGDDEYPCRWKSCVRNRKNQPIAQLSRLIRHCKEVHVKVANKHVFPQHLSRNYFNKYAVQNGRPGTPGNNSAVMGIVGPPTPVGMVQQQITPSLNPSMMGANHPSMMASPAHSMMQPYSKQASMNANSHPMMQPNPAQYHPNPPPPQNNVAIGSMGVPILNPATRQGMSIGGMQDMQGYGVSTPGMHPSMQYPQQPGQQQQPGMYQQQMPPPQSQYPHHQQPYSMQPHYQQQQGGMPAPQYPNQNMGIHPQQGMYNGNRMAPSIAPGMAPSQHMMSSMPSYTPMPFGSPYPSPAIAPSPYSQGQQGGQNSAPSQPAQPPHPLFVAAPPRTQRVLHSEAYIRYIEGLDSNKSSVSNWKHELSAKEDQVQLDHQQKSRLPGHWLANGPGPEGDLVKSLWKLRDMMMQDSLRISKTSYIDEDIDLNPEPNPEQAKV